LRRFGADALGAAAVPAKARREKAPVNILVLNCGSSSLKYRLIAMPEEKELAAGEAQRIGPKTAEPSRIVHRQDKRELTITVPMASHAAAFEQIMALLAQNAALAPDAIGHRVVHGGARFSRPTVINREVVGELVAIQGLAPLHNPPATALIKACQARYAQLPQVALFDTSFHATIPDYARTYALPKALRDDMGIRKYGFHGTSHQYVVEEAARWLGRPLERFNAVSCHLGSGGASLCAVLGGKSVDNTMGYSPLQGLVMSTRCGDLDPAVTLKLLIEAAGSTAEVESMLNKSSGVLRLSGISGDIRDVLAAVSKTSKQSQRMNRTAQVYLWRIRKYLGAYLAVVGRTDAIIFTDTIGESVPLVRASVCVDMEFFGLKIDAQRNAAVKGMPADVAADSSRVRILVVQTNEELAIARETYRALRPNVKRLEAAGGGGVS